MRYKNYIFDLYGTLIDIHTDENQQELWDFMSKYLEDNFSTTVTPEQLCRDYVSICADEEQKLAAKNGSNYPEIKIEDVWQRLIGREVASIEMKTLCNTFREKSRDKLVRYDGVEDLLHRIKSDGGKIFLLSNAQRLFTEKELEDTDLIKYFDDIFISSDLGIKKPDGNFMEALINKNKLIKSDCVMVGNEVLADCGVAAAAGVDVIYINSYNHSESSIQADLIKCGAKNSGIGVELLPAGGYDKIL